MDLLLIISSCEPASSFNHFLPTRNTFNGKKKTKIKLKITFRIKFGEHFFSRVSRKNIYVPVTHVQTFTWTLSWHVDKSEGKKKYKDVWLILRRTFPACARFIETFIKSMPNSPVAMATSSEGWDYTTYSSSCGTIVWFPWKGNWAKKKLTLRFPLDSTYHWFI